MIWILYVVLSVNASGSPRPVAFTAEHSTREACEKAKESIRNKITDSKVVLLTCELK